MPHLNTTVKISVPGNHLMTALLGPRDELLRLVERSFDDAAIHVRGNEINVDGPGAQTVGRVFEELVMLLQQGHPLESRTVTRTIDMVRADERPSQVLTTEIMRTARGATVRPKSSGQKRYVDAIKKSVVTFGIGPAGTGKSSLADEIAVRSFQ
jgi:phosphate starvation-inducible PhoH-like protein